MAKKHSVLNKTAGHCAYCGCTLNVNNMTRDHVVAKSRGGTSELDNLLPACRACNLLKGDDSLDSFRLRFFWDTLRPSDLATYDTMIRLYQRRSSTLNPSEPGAVRFYRCRRFNVTKNVILKSRGQLPYGRCHWLFCCRLL